MSSKKYIFIEKGRYLASKRECKEDIDMLKRIYGVFNYQDLADKLEITESAIKGWVKRKSIPRKYLQIIEKHRIESINNYFEEYQENTNKNTLYTKKNINNIENELCKLIKQLSDQEKEYYYHEIKSQILKKSL